MVIKSELVENKFGKNKFNNSKYSVNEDVNAMGAGYRASKEINLGNFVSSTEKHQQLS